MILIETILSYKYGFSDSLISSTSNIHTDRNCNYVIL